MWPWRVVSSSVTSHQSSARAKPWLKIGNWRPEGWRLAEDGRL